MPSHVALLRAVNLGGKNKVAMGELRELVESLGHTEVSTFIQSGNVIFNAVGPVDRRGLETAIAARFGIDVAVMLRTADELRAVVAANPFRVDPSNLHVGFMAEAPPATAVAALDVERFWPEELAVLGTELYLHLPAGMARTKLPGYLDRQLKVPTTVRTWRTVSRLAEMAADHRSRQ